MDPLMGTMMLNADSFIPSGWMLCDGRLLSIMEYAALFSLLGTQYGGDGVTQFALPSKEGPGPGLTWIIAVEGIFPSRAQ